MSFVKGDLLYVEHVIESIQTIKSYIADVTYDDFGSNHMMYDAVIRNLQILAESTQKISAVVKIQNPKIPWRDISGLRNILVHDYLEGIDPNAVWNIIKNDLPELQKQFAHIKLSLTK